MLKIGVNKYEGWKSYGINLPTGIDVSTNPVVTIKIITEQDIMLDVYFVDDANNNKNVRKRISRADSLITVCFDFTGTSNVNLANVTKMYFAVNGTALTYVGNLWFDELKVGTDAQKLPNFSGVPNQTVYQNSKKNIIYIQGIDNVQNLSFASTPTLINNITYTYPTPSTLRIEYDAIAGAVGSEALTLQADGTNGRSTNSFTFQMTVEGNNSPTFTVPTNYKCKVGNTQNIQISDVSDGNGTVRQDLSFQLSADNINVIGTDYQILYNQDAPTATLQFTPKTAGTSTVTLTLNDGQATNNSTTKTFTVVAYDEWNAKPTIDKINSMLIYNNESEKTITLSGISDGDETAQNLTIKATSSDETIIPDPTIQYTSGGNGTLKFTPQSDKIGVVDISVSVVDNGGNAHNNGNDSTKFTFSVDVQSPPLKGYTIPLTDYAGDRANKLWTVENDSTAQTIAYEKDGVDDVLKINCISKSTFTGLWYGLNNQKFDLSQNPYITMWVKADQDISFHMYFWDYQNERNNVNPTIGNSLPANVWTKVTYDFYGKMVNSKNVPIAADKINKLLFNYHPVFGFPFTTWKGTVWLKDIRIGNQADSIFAHPKICTLNDVAGITTYSDATMGTVELSNISDGDGGIATATAASSNTAVVQNPTVSATTNGKATLTYNLGGTAGTATITVTVTADSSANISKTFVVNVQVANPTTTSTITIDLNSKFQTMRGIGAYVDDAVKPYLSNYIDDFGASIARIGVIGNQLEPVNDNDDPYILDRSALDYKAYDWDFYKELHAKGIEHFILTIWSVPAWMKQNASENYFQARATIWENTDNKVDTAMYQEYAEYAVMLVKVFKEKTGIDLYGIGLQNEPGFCEPYPSAVLSPELFVKLINIVGRRFELEGIKCRLYMAEQVLGQGQYSVNEYLLAVQHDHEAWKYCDVQAVHGYAGDGITAYTANCTQWTGFLNNVQAAPHPKEFWMTETEPSTTNWTEIMSNLGAMSTAFTCGNISLWAQWGYTNRFNIQGKSNQLAYGESQFAKFVKPGSVRVAATTEDNNLLVTSFANTSKYNKNLATVVINKGTTPVSIKLSGSNIPATYEVYQTYYLINFNKSVVGAQKDVAYLLPAQSITTFVSPLPNAAPTIDPIADQVIMKNSAEQVVTLTGITDGGEGNQMLTVTPTVLTGSNAITNVHVDYYSPEHTSKLYYTLVNDQSGNASIKVEVADDGLVNNKTTMNCNISISTSTSVDVVKDNGFKVYPNPASEYVILKLPNNSYQTATIINLMGETVVQHKLRSEVQQMDISYLKGGIYIIQIKGEEGIISKQLIVK